MVRYALFRLAQKLNELDPSGRSQVRGRHDTQRGPAGGTRVGDDDSENLLPSPKLSLSEERPTVMYGLGPARIDRIGQFFML